MKACKLAVSCVFVVWLAAVNSVGQTNHPYQDVARPVEARVSDLLARMTLEEKVGQLNMPCLYLQALGGTLEEKDKGVRQFTLGTREANVGPGGGFFTLANHILLKGPRQQAEYFNQIQKLAAEETRLGIPLLQTEEGTHGLMCSGGTIFPEGLAIGSTWNLDLIREIYAAAAREARAVGIHQLFTLVIEPYRDPRLGRNQEGYSEDPYYASQIARAIAEATQGQDVSASDKVVAGFCHYPGQSEPVSGLERGAMEISERTLREVFLPPWQAAISGSGALGVMATYPAIDGVPVHASSWILTEILRSELGFEGLVLSEGEGIETLVYEGLAPTQKEAGILALKAGVDVGISYEQGYMGPLVESVREGLIPEKTIDRSVARILRQKMKLGLFEDPYVEVNRAVKVSNTATSRALALQAAREGVVLLKNEADLLPLRKDLRSIAVIGPNANHVRNQLGDYTSLEVLQDVVTILEGIRARVSEGTEIRFAKGCDVIGGDRNGFDEARAAAASADVAVVVVGENEWQAAGRKGTSGEGYDVANLDLTGLQQELVKMVHATGTPTVVVLVNGRPLSTRWIAGNVPAILESWCSGEEGGNAVADVLFGEINPSGRLPVTIPRHSGQLPVYYNHKKSKAYWIEHGWGNSYADMSPEPLWEFGFGLSYTEFKYSGLQLSSGEIGVGETVRISCDVENVGKRAGTEVVQLYVHDPIATVSTPVQELKGFSRVQLNPGEKKTVSFELLPEHLSLLDRQLRRVVEPGEFEVQIGHSSKDIRLRESFEVVAGK